MIECPVCKNPMRESVNFPEFWICNDKKHDLIMMGRRPANQITKRLVNKHQKDIEGWKRSTSDIGDDLFLLLLERWDGNELYPDSWEEVERQLEDAISMVTSHVKTIFMMAEADFRAKKDELGEFPV